MMECYAKEIRLLKLANSKTRMKTRAKMSLETGVVPEQPKEKHMTLGQHLDSLRKEEAEVLLSKAEIEKYEVYENYLKDDVLSDLNASAPTSSDFNDQLYFTPDKTSILFLTLKTHGIPDSMTHICNKSGLRWDTSAIQSPIHLSRVCMVFVRSHVDVDGTSEMGDTYKYLGLLGVRNSCQGPKIPGSTSYCTLHYSFTMDYPLNRNEIQQLGRNVIGCFKNKYGSCICSKGKVGTPVTEEIANAHVLK